LYEHRTYLLRYRLKDVEEAWYTLLGIVEFLGMGDISADLRAKIKGGTDGIPPLLDRCLGWQAVKLALISVASNRDA
jgi:hypothetical protein